MSAKPPKADMCGALAHVRFAPSGHSQTVFAGKERPPLGGLSSPVAFEQNASKQGADLFCSALKT